MINSKYFPTFSIILLLIFLLASPGVFAPGDAAAQSKGSNAGSSDNQSLQVIAIQSSINDSIQAENRTIDNLKGEISLAESSRKNLDPELNAYRVQHSAFSSLLFMPTPQLRILENAFDALQTSFATIKIRIEKLRAQLHENSKMQSAAEEQYNLVTRQQSDYVVVGRTEPSRSINKNLQILKKLIIEKQTLLKKLSAIHTSELDRLQEIKQTFSTLSAKYNKALAMQRRRTLLHRDLSPFSKSWSVELDKMSDEAAMSATHLKSKGFWLNKLQPILDWEIYGSLSFVLLLGLTLGFSWRAKKAIHALVGSDFYNRSNRVQMPLNQLQKTVLPLGTTLFLYGYLLIVDISPLSELIRVAIDLLMIWIFTCWGLTLTRNGGFRGFEGSNSFRKRLRFLFFSIRWIVTIFVLAAWLFQYNKLALQTGRLIFEIFLLGFGIYFWGLTPFKRSHWPKTNKHWTLNAFRWGSLALIALGLIFELGGYGSLASFWYISWAKTAAIGLWGYFALSFLSEMNQRFKRLEESDMDQANLTSYQIRWFTLRLARVFTPLIFILVGILAWGGTQSIIANTYFVLSYKFNIGNMAFSLLSFVYAVLVLLATSLVTRLWRNAFQNRFLRHSLIESGLQESITTISVYVIWLLGIILALNMFGLNPTSLLVIFGALGIGLGFGLQNIFGNFMSGLILLFERPIQVGDDIEVNGVWAQVKKINVRSTLVQTYDNASLIIPNSDLINNQVTNWTFKDKRLRRQISVGVAYGSDIELVRQTLLEIAEKAPKVLKSPAPDVLFTDFGDSSLIFVLRLWTHLHCMFQVDTNIRFAIDGEFRNKNITIAFPQRDVHIHTAEK